jgi:hypothetical protein
MALHTLQALMTTEFTAEVTVEDAQTELRTAYMMSSREELQTHLFHLE